ncbi:hypothetical protein AbraCBS73388_003208 [Aspergillus brasiliensis]|uniref:Uncharacterized protein n=1 Tax=Aspergillus brasiliensis TaxID=319629 RepID=A0A9W5Z2C6_9EURO|nr:hypothetical protein AbraCBS73388_003208 [Aspergillus brasiliensis]
MATVTTSTSSTAAGVAFRSASDLRSMVQWLQRLAEAHELWEFLDIDTEELPEAPPNPERFTLQTLQGIARSQQATLATFFRTFYHNIGLSLAQH